MPYEQFSRRLGMVSFSTFSRVQGSIDNLNMYFRKMMIVNSFICFPIFIGLYSVADNFTLVLLGEKWAEMIDPLKIMSISFLVLSIMDPIISLNISMGIIKKQTLIRVLAAAILIFLLIWGVPYGIEIACYMILIVNVFLFITSFWLLKQNIKIRYIHILVYLFPAIFSSLILYYSVYLSSRYITLDSRVLSLFIDVTVGTISYFLCTILIPFKEWKFIRKRIIERIKLISKVLAPC
jgi:O-antigen/teichoic acid export membrane protein